MDADRGWGRAALAALAAAGLTAALAACTAGPPAETTPAAAPTSAAPTAPASATPSTPEPGVTPSPTPPATEPPVPLTVDCGSMLSPQQLYDFNPNYGADPGYTPTAAAAVQAVESGGTACGWLNQSSGGVIETAVATLRPAALAQLRAAAASGTAVPDWGDGWFAVVDGVGTAQVFDGDTWLVVAAADFLGPADAQQLVEELRANF